MSRNSNKANAPQASTSPADSTQPPDPKAPAGDAPPPDAGAMFDKALISEQLASMHRHLAEQLALAAAGDADAIAFVENVRFAAESSLALVGAGSAPAAVDEPAAPYAPVGKVRVIAEGKRSRILEDDVRRWKEPRE